METLMPVDWDLVEDMRGPKKRKKKTWVLRTRLRSLNAKPLQKAMCKWKIDRER